MSRDNANIFEKLIVQELVIVLATKGQNPTVLNPDFLKYSGIIPADWELARQPIFTNSFVQIVFTNSVVITAQANQLTVAEMVADKAPEAVIAPSLARKYVETLPHVEYQAVGINPRGIVAGEVVQDYIAQTLLASGSWQEFEGASPRATVNFIYPLKEKRLNLNVQEAVLKQEDKAQTLPAVLFGGNFEYLLESSTLEERRQQLYQRLESWQTDLKTYKELVESRFLASTKPDSGSKEQNGTPSIKEQPLAVF